MQELNPILKKLQYKEAGQAVLIMNAPSAYHEVMSSFKGEVHQEPSLEGYSFVQVFGVSNEELQTKAQKAEPFMNEDGLLWICYPKKSSKTYKGSDCSRESVAEVLASRGYEPVRQVAIDEDWSALRFRKVEHIKTMTRKSAVTEKGKKRIEQ
ncbi:DUF3052 domain-containing protein [Cytobacillus spongiae]|uniref:DUF3052 domain-containing protein n=1 Tax=Cytobacillus spongiae TaxID=2901381 RepID=UPI001F3E098D|nr:DUF3052 domain-containing protein [Cytobacillus spongiae]UII56604.1 DUF3052 domain-containing protein [Cytobacillus spongiae]